MMGLLLSACGDTRAVTPCTTSATCPATQPWCDPALAGCTACSDSTQCASRTETPLCSLGTGACVECLTDSNCPDETAVCDMTSATCVECVSGDDCSGETPVCASATQTCVECVVSNDCTGDTFVCDGTSQTCVECVTDTDCDPNACRPDSTCGSIAVGTLGNCETCEADGECLGARNCIEMNFDGSSQGTFCLQQKSGPGCDRPFSTIDRDSIHGAAGPYCGPRESLTTCDAFLDFLSQDCTMDSDCGAEGVNDALCRDDGDGLMCTYECGGTEDCSSGFQCSTENPRYCCTGATGPGCSD